MFLPVSGPITNENVTNENVTKLGVVGVAVGLPWMWWIVRADPEPDSRS